MISSPATEQVPLSRLVDDYALYSSNFLRIVTKAGDLVPFVWNAPQQKLARAVRWQTERGLPIRVVVLKSRRVGISTWIQGFLFHRTHLRPNRTALTVAHVSDSSIKLFDMSRTFYDNLIDCPIEPLQVEKRTLTRKQITFARSRSSTQVVVVGTGAGRGFNCSYLHASEAGFWEDTKKTMNAVKSAVPKIPDSAAFIESTANGWGNEFHTQYLRAKTRRSGYIAVFIGWNDDPTCQMVPWFGDRDLDEEEAQLQAEYHLTLPQLAWRRDTIENECDGDMDVFHQEYPINDKEAFVHSGRPAFDSDGLRYQTDALPEPDAWEGMPPSCEIQWNGETKQPELSEGPRGRLIVFPGHPKPRHQYLLGADPSEGDPGSTASPLVGLDRTDLSVAAVWYGRTPPDILAEHAVLICRFLNEAGLIWEANNHGLAFGLRVRELEYHNVYMRRVSVESVTGEVADKPGYMSTERARQDLFNTLRKFVREAPQRNYAPVRHPILVQEMTTLVYEGDKAQAQEGCLHDTLIALGLPLYWHRGNMDSPLEPLGAETMRAAYQDFAMLFRTGQRPREEDLLKYQDLTCEDLERYDEMVHEQEVANRRLGIGRPR